jgi:hypothetical protein
MAERLSQTTLGSVDKADPLFDRSQLGEAKDDPHRWIQVQPTKGLAALKSQASHVTGPSRRCDLLAALLEGGLERPLRRVASTNI